MKKNIFLLIAKYILLEKKEKKNETPSYTFFTLYTF